MNLKNITTLLVSTTYLYVIWLRDIHNYIFIAPRSVFKTDIITISTSKIIGFRGYLGLFFRLFFGRFVLFFELAWEDRGSLHLGAFQRICITEIIAALCIYVVYSVLRYFGLKRAAGSDHLTHDTAICHF
jgi:hypothetical protein